MWFFFKIVLAAVVLVVLLIGWGMTWWFISYIRSLEESDADHLDRLGDDTNGEAESQT